VAFRLALVQEPLQFGAATDPIARRSRGKAPAGVGEEIYRLALGMLWHPADAEDVRAEILRAGEELGIEPSRGDARATLLGIAARHLLELPASFFERQGWTFEALAEDLVRGSDEPLPPKAFGTNSLALLDEVRLGCWQTMLLCLDRPHRIAYVLSMFEDLEQATAASVLGIDADEFAARARRAEDLLRRFTESHCGLVNSALPCRCSRRLGRALVTGRVDPDELLFARLLPPNARAS
jgi:DNA-directed RNA polymerase specialized sigma24 family protein